MFFVPGRSQVRGVATPQQLATSCPADYYYIRLMNTNHSLLILLYFRWFYSSLGGKTLSTMSFFHFSLSRRRRSSTRLSQRKRHLFRGKLENPLPCEQWWEAKGPNPYRKGSYHQTVKEHSSYWFCVGLTIQPSEKYYATNMSTKEKTNHSLPVNNKRFNWTVTDELLKSFNVKNSIWNQSI